MARQGKLSPEALEARNAKKLANKEAKLVKQSEKEPILNLLFKEEFVNADKLLLNPNWFEALSKHFQSDSDEILYKIKNLLK